MRFDIFNKQGGISGLSLSQKDDDASAELIGSIILIGLFVAAFGIVLMTLLSSTSDFVVPAVVIEPQPITEWNGTYVLDMRAGDTLLRDETRIIVDGRDRTADFVEDPSSDPGDAGWQEWGVGDSLYLAYSGSEAPNAVQVIYSGPDGGGILLWEQGSTENRLPVAAFSANVTGGYSPLSVRFTDASSNNPTSWIWSFGDGETSSLQNPVHTYGSPGDYTVRLTVTNLYDTDTLVKSAYIHVADEFTVDFVGTPRSGTAPLMVTFTDQTTGAPTAWSWAFGDGATSTQQNPVHEYSGSGPYTVSLTVTDGTSSDTETKDQYINVTGMPDPVAWWRFDEASGNTAVDSSGNGNDGTIEGGAADRRTGACGTGLYFDGTTTWVNVPNDATLSFNDTFTFAGWFKPEVPEYAGAPDTFRNYTQVIGKGYDDYENEKYSNNYEIFLRVANDRLRFEENGESDAVNVEGAISDVDGLPLSYNDWFHLAVVVDGGTGIVYVDGQEEETFSVKRTPLQENTEPVSIGRQQVTKYDWANFSYKGMMDELYLYGTALTAAEVNTLKDACTPPAGDPPEVTFAATPLTGDAPLAVQFTSNVTGTAPLTYLWNFGDGTTSTDADPLHTYASVGNYTVNLTVTNAFGSDLESKTDYITAESPFSCDQAGLIGIYYNTRTWEGAPVIRTDERIFFADHEATIRTPPFASDIADWPEGIIGGNGDIFSVEYRGYLIVDEEDDYTFNLTTDDGSYLWIDDIELSDTPVISKPSYTPLSKTASVHLDVGCHPIRVRMEEGWGKAVFYLSWSSSAIPETYDMPFCQVDCSASVAAPVAAFSGTPTSGSAPLTVSFTDASTGTPTAWYWDFGDGEGSSDQNPVHTYDTAGTYDVSLTVLNAGGMNTLERADYVEVTAVVVSAFAQYVVDENVFVYGQELSFAGDSVTGPGATIHITGKDLKSDDLNGGSSIAVSNIYVDGNIDLNGGSAGLGSPTNPGSIYVNGNLELQVGSRDIYGDVYVSKKCYLKDPVIHGNVYVDGNLELADTPDLTDGHVYYTGNFKHPKDMDSSILDKCVEVATVPGFVIPDYDMLPVKSDDFYSSRGYVSGGALADDIRIFADSYTAINAWPAPSTTEDVIIVAKSGDIRLTGMGNRIVTGILFAPNGEVVFEGSSFEGLVIAKDGFTVTSGGTAVTFKNMNQYISNPADYPF